jgi:DNA-binding PadR family transcriptional regulator
MSQTVHVSPTQQDPPSLSGKERIVLELLAGEDRMYGLQLVAQSRGRLKRGTVYVTLGRMQQKNLIEAEPEKLSDDSGLVPRRMYRATPFGLRVLRAWTHAARMLAWGEAGS